MAHIKVGFVFNSQRNGWTEVWYVEGSTVDAARPKALLVAAKRDNCVGFGGTIEALRLSTIEKPVKSVVLPSGLPLSGSIPNADTPWQAILGRVYSPSKEYSRNVWLRCPVDDWVKRIANASFNPNATGALPAWQQFVATLKAQGFCFAGRDKSGPGGTFRPVASFTLEAGTRRLQALVAGSTVGPGGKISFSEVTGDGAKPTINGLHKVRSNDGSLVILETVVPLAVNPVNWSTGKARDYVPIFPLVDSGEILRVTKRSTGRAFFVTRGRRSSRAK